MRIIGWMSKVGWRYLIWSAIAVCLSPLVLIAVGYILGSWLGNGFNDSGTGMLIMFVAPPVAGLVMAALLAWPGMVRASYVGLPKWVGALPAALFPGNMDAPTTFQLFSRFSGGSDPVEKDYFIDLPFTMPIFTAFVITTLILAFLPNRSEKVKFDLLAIPALLLVSLAAVLSLLQSIPITGWAIKGMITDSHQAIVTSLVLGGAFLAWVWFLRQRNSRLLQMWPEAIVSVLIAAATAYPYFILSSEKIFIEYSLPIVAVQFLVIASIVVPVCHVARRYREGVLPRLWVMVLLTIPTLVCLAWLGERTDAYARIEGDRLINAAYYPVPSGLPRVLVIDASQPVYAKDVEGILHVDEVIGIQRRYDAPADNAMPSRHLLLRSGSGSTVFSEDMRAYGRHLGQAYDISLVDGDKSTILGVLRERVIRVPSFPPVLTSYGFGADSSAPKTSVSEFVNQIVSRSKK